MSRIQQGIAQEHPEWIIPRMCQQNANKTGIYIAIFTGLITLPLARKCGLDKNRALFSALGASGLGGYISSKYTYHYCRKTHGFLQAMDKVTESQEKKHQ